MSYNGSRQIHDRKLTFRGNDREPSYAFRQELFHFLVYSSLSWAILHDDCDYAHFEMKICKAIFFAEKMQYFTVIHRRVCVDFNKKNNFKVLFIYTFTLACAHHAISTVHNFSRSILKF